MRFDEFLRDRRDAITKAVMEDDWEPVRAYCKKYGTELPENETILKAGIFKAAVAVTDIPDEVKETAKARCRELGFSPNMYRKEDVI